MYVFIYIHTHDINLKSGTCGKCRAGKGPGGATVSRKLHL